MEHNTNLQTYTHLVDIVEFMLTHVRHYQSYVKDFINNNKSGE